MSFIGSLEQHSLRVALQKIEDESKNGVLIVRRETKWVELSFRQGQLMCIGPVRSHKTIGDRLRQAGVISQKALEEISSITGLSLQNETRTVGTLIDMGYLNQDNLYKWAAQEATTILQVLLGWTAGEMFFEEGVQPPQDRLLIALPISTLIPLPSRFNSSHIADASDSSVHPQKKTESRTTPAHIPDSLTLHEPSQFYSASGKVSSSDSIDLSESAAVDIARNTGALFPPANPGGKPERLSGRLVPKHISSGLMQPQMVVHPADLSTLRDQKLQVQLTPEQWRLLTIADGITTLQMACQQLIMSRELVCQAAAELVAMNLITLRLPNSGMVLDSSLLTSDGVNTSYAYGNVPQAERSLDAFSPPPIETHSQWGNGGTGATFVLGNGWVVASSSTQSAQTSESNGSRTMDYAAAGGM